MSPQTQEKSFFDHPQLYLAKPFGVRVRARLARQLLGIITTKEILDIGCGDGSISLPFLDDDNKLTLLDLSKEMLALAMKNCPQEKSSQVRWLNQDFLSYEPDGLFDFVLCFGVLAHVPDVSAAVKKIASLLRPNGKALIQFSDQERLVTRVQSLMYAWRQGTASYSYRTNPLTYHGMLNEIRNNSLEVVKEIRYSILLPGMGRLPDSWLYNWQIFTLEHALTAHLATEVVLTVQKTVVAKQP